jgi:hypothetical protein
MWLPPVCEGVAGVRTVNMQEERGAPNLSPERPVTLGYWVVACPLSPLGNAVRGMEAGVRDLKAGRTPTARVDFAAMRDLVEIRDCAERVARHDTGAVREAVTVVSRRETG